MDAYTPMSTCPSTPGLDEAFLTVSPADTDLRRRSVSFADDVQDMPSTQEKKPAKKRKSWGQELPTPTTNLPPRKRAKTEAEKEQRRVERVIRNRNAAHASRERKRAEVDKLEEERDIIQNQRDSLARELEQMRHDNQMLKDQVAQLSTLITASNQGTPHSFSDATSPTLAPQLFKHEAQDALSLDHVPNHPSPLAQTALPTPSTLNESVATPSELTQHPAAMLCSDLQCHSEVITLAHLRLMQIMTVTHSIIQALFLTMVSTIYSSVTHPLAQILTSLKWGKPMITTSPMALTLMTWLISRPSATLSMTRSTSRLRLLRRMLTCTPALARPLCDATGAVLQLAIGSKVSRRSRDRQGSVERPWDTLMATLWAIESRHRGDCNRDLGSGMRRLALLSHRRRERGRHVYDRRSVKSGPDLAAAGEAWSREFPKN